MAKFATGNSEEALDIVQDAMMILARRYAGRDAAEWGPLFHRILQNRIRDWYRRQGSRSRLFSWFSPHQDDKHPSEVVEDTVNQGPMQSLHNLHLGQALQEALATLPVRQQQTFLLRAWEGMNVAETAKAMGISAGSVTIAGGAGNA